MIKDFDILINKLESVKSIIQKNEILDEDQNVVNFLKSHIKIKSIISDLPIRSVYVLKALMAINQAETVLYNLENILKKDSLLKELCETLLSIEEFYYPIGGIIGYHNYFLKLLKDLPKNENISFYKPEYTDIRTLNKNIEEFIKIGLENLNQFVFICPMGGAGDRLNLYNEKTKEPLPAAVLNFNGFTLIENLIRDLQALEYLYYKTFKKEILTPLIIMTSEEKNNHNHIISIFEKNNWFKRDKKSFYFIKQPSVPLITKEGHWTLKAPLKLALKPSGHGVIWHLMEKTKAYDFLKSHKRDKAIIRQINNPIAGIDYLLLTLMGIAIKNNKAFGFVSCPSLSEYKEGVNVLREEKQKKGFFYNISNIEYTDFESFNEKKLSNSNIYKFPSNTNILFANLNEIKKASKNNPFPGLIINLKTQVFTKDITGKITQTKAGRIESLMQNIADSIQDYKPEKIKKEEQKTLKTFLILSERTKTISTTKNAFVEGKDFLETTQKCFYDVLTNYYDLLKNFCKMNMPNMPSIKDFFMKGPTFLCSMNPMIGPLYSIISKKIKGGTFVQGSEMHLEIAEILMENLYLNGSLIIETSLIKNSKKDIYNLANCFLKNVKIKNLGIDTNSNNIYWQNKIKRNEYCKITLGENSQFYATNVDFFNTHEIIVPSNHKMFILKKNNKIMYKIEKL